MKKLSGLLCGDLLVGVATALILAGCQPNVENKVSIEQAPKAIGHAECGLCGMVVGEQPGPRGQVVHVGGKHVFLCSVGDLATYLKMPSAHGPVLQSYVEVLEAETELAGDLKRQWPWSPAQSAFFVAGVERKRIMGEPMLAYEDEAAAGVAVHQHGGEVLSWEATFERLTR